MDNKFVNLILLITIIGEFVIPYILKAFYKGYNSKKMLMSVLGSYESPVRRIYNAWLVWLGTFLLFVSFLLFKEVCAISGILATLTFLSVAVFSVGAGILAGLFSVNESKENVTITSKMHGIGSAIGFMALLFFALLRSITAFTINDFVQAVVCAVAFVLSVLFFVFFIMGDKDNFKDTIFAYEGLWERLCLFFMYMPFLYGAITNLLVVWG